MSDKKLADIVAHSKAYGFIFPSSQIYTGLQAVYDYGPYGVLLKRNLKSFWWKSMTQLHDNIVGLDAAILMATPTWKASGHLDNFHDWMVENKETNKRFRVDHLIEDKIEKLADEGNQKAADALAVRLATLLTEEDAAGLTALLAEEQISDTTAKRTVWSDVKRFSLMFATEAGAAEGHTQKIYLRPETAQGIFVNFSNIQQTTRMKVPFGVAQIGKAFRNEIVARQFIFRMREFEQMEMQFFIPPEDSTHWFAHWREKRRSWYETLGIPTGKISYYPHVKLAHYASAAGDLVYPFPFGMQEIEGIHARGDFDLSSHAQHAKKKISYFDPKCNASYIPHVIETSAGLDRLVLMMLTEGYTQTAERTYLKFPPPLAPMQAAILPLLKKEPLTTKGRAIFQSLASQFRLTYDETGSIGKRYTRQDLIGTPYAITVDFQTLEEGTVTVREIVSTAQVRIPVEGLADYLSDRVDMQRLWQKSCS